MIRHTEKTLASIVFHGPVNSTDCRREVAKLAQRNGGKLRYLSFHDKRRGWHSEKTTGKAAYTAVVPVAGYRAAVREARRLEVAGLKFSHRWSHFGSL